MIKLLLLLSIVSSMVNAEVKVGDSAPTFFVRDINGNNFFLSDSLENHQPIILSFFATWCGPCRKEMPILDSLSTVFPKTQFYLVNVSGLTQNGHTMKEKPEKVTLLLESLHVELPVLMDKYGKVAEKYGVTTLPRLVIIDQQSKISYIHDGFVDGDEKELTITLETLQKTK